jgi:hypothetical protein
MSEGSKDAAILIATSWQALNRAIRGDSDTLVCDCTVLILFAGFFVEANLNYITNELHMKKQMISFLDNKPHPGLQDKLGWFYNQYIARTKATTKKQLFANGIERKLRRRYPGFANLYRFRNDISHGVVNRSAKSLEEAMQMRQQAKNMVDDLFDVASRAGHDIPRVITYSHAVSS